MNPILIFHVAISLAGLFTGFAVLFGLLSGKPLNGWTAWFLGTTVATSATGFLLPAHGFMPSHAVGIISLLLLWLAIYARYSHRLAGPWRKVYVFTALAALYLNLFVGIVQTFEKVPALKAMDPTQSKPPFMITQLAVLLLFMVLSFIAARKFRGEQAV